MKKKIKREGFLLFGLLFYFIFSFAQNDFRNVVWVHSSNDSNKMKSFSDCYWIQFEEKNFILSNSNNRKISQWAGIWSYYTGQYDLKNNFLELRVDGSFSFSTNTGRFIDIDNLTKGEVPLKFSLEIDENQNLILISLGENNLLESKSYILTKSTDHFYIPKF